MPKKSSVIKRIAIAERNRYQNKVYKSTIKTLTKKYLEEAHQADSSKDLKSLQLLLNQVYSKIDKAVKKGIIHNNSAARKKAFLAKALK